MAKQVYRVLCSQPKGRRRGGRRWDAGQTIVKVADMSDATLAALEADGTFVVALVDETEITANAADAGTGTDGGTGDEGNQIDEGKLNDLKAAIKKLEAGDFTKSGVPQTKALAKKIDGDVSTAERDAAFEALKAEGFEAPRAE